MLDRADAASAAGRGGGVADAAKDNSFLPEAASRSKMGAMSVSDSDLTTPVLLMAMPQVLDPFFHRSVVLLLHHEDEGSFGFIVNRPTGIKVGEILKGMDVGWRGREEAVAYFGGPVQPQLGTVLFAPVLAGGRTGGHGDRDRPGRGPDPAHRRPLPPRRGAAGAASACSSATPAGARGSSWRRSSATTG